MYLGILNELQRLSCLEMNFSICRKHKRSREWVVVNMVKIEALKKRNVDNKKLIFNGVKQYTNEYQAQVLNTAKIHVH
ncbi:hypothetical protein Tco_1494487, partial [Tanacetum coccineum]